ncbi:MAG: dihydrodipicolinate synthase family protein [Betaproteobacteria bacterium]|nr:dihydrodipicolinate synthase family protein [Betaproteobacteria bacterium]
MSKQYSAIVHSLTPFNEKYELDENALRLHLRRLCAAGVSVYLGAAGASEGYTLTRDERNRVLAVAVEELKGKVPVRAAGVEPRDAAEMSAYLRDAEAIKVDAAQIYSLDMGHGLIPSRRELEGYFRAAIEATSLPVIISNQKKVGYALPLDLVEQLAARYSNFVGFAYDVNDAFYMIELLQRLGGRLEIHCSGTENALFTLGMGGNGYQGMEGNIAPKLAATVVSAFVAKDMDLMHESFRKLMQLRAILRGPVRSNQRAAKALLNAYELSGGIVRPPRLPVSPEELDDVIKAVQLLEIPEMASWQLRKTPGTSNPGRTSATH